MRDVHVDTPSGRYAAIDFGGEGPDVLLLHQIASNAQVWAPLGVALAEFAHPVAIDLCGHGRTRVGEESLERLLRDLPAVVEALGLHRPLVIIENEELLPLVGDGFATVDACGLLVVGPSSSKRGEAAENEYQEILGIDSIDVWDARNSMFMTGTPEERQAFIDRRTSAAVADWVNEGVPQEQLRRYIERQIRDTEDGWERVPRRPLVEQTLERVGRGPFGLDLYDGISIPVWVAVGAQDVTDAEVDELSAWAGEHDLRRAAFLPGYGPPDSFEAEPLALYVRDMLTATAVGA
ncbi:alpha/beta fold hydrolase [Mobilicoccus caccae]|nr:alpha/beta hydrolase [Mobilicoccus caccae]